MLPHSTSLAFIISWMKICCHTQKWLLKRRPLGQHTWSSSISKNQSENQELVFWQLTTKHIRVKTCTQSRMKVKIGNSNQYSQIWIMKCKTQESEIWSYLLNFTTYHARPNSRIEPLLWLWGCKEAMSLLVTMIR